MRAIPALELADCQHIAAAAEAMAAQHQAKVSLAICDGGGHPLLLLRLDGASPSRRLGGPGQGPHGSAEWQTHS
jgi:glc operon protein GlcG